MIPRGFRDVVVDTGAILHYDQSIEMFQPLDPKGAELEAWCVVVGGAGGGGVGFGAGVTGARVVMVDRCRCRCW